MRESEREGAGSTRRSDRDDVGGDTARTKPFRTSGDSLLRKERAEDPESMVSIVGDLVGPE